MADDKKVIFSMSKVSKTYSSTNKQVLKDIYLSFFYGAKIGILGLNGSGKSSLLKIVAGIDKNFQGDLVFAPGYKVGYLEQEPQLDETKTVIEIVREGAAETIALLVCLRFMKIPIKCKNSWTVKQNYKTELMLPVLGKLITN
jgi:ATPase subunit of ABC transporter with duplicated ATPase domains